MGPLFSVLIVLLFGSPVVLFVFAICKFFLPFRPALIVTAATVTGGTIGLAGGLIVQSPFLPDTLESKSAVLLFLGTGCLAGILSAVLAGVAAWRILAQAHAGNADGANFSGGGS